MLGIAVFILISFPFPIYVMWVLFGNGRLQAEIYGYQRKNEKLPTVLIENGNIAYCRMRVCDFRFPLPKASSMVKIGLTEWGFDTINGFIDVSATNGMPVDLDAYSSRLSNFNLAEGGSVYPLLASGKSETMRIKFSYFGDY